MRLRIRTGRAKTLYVIGSIILILLVGLTLSFALSDVAAQLGALALGIALLIIGVRSFRGPSEALEPPRVWWRMTERPFAGYLLAVNFALQCVGYLVAPFSARPIEALYLGVFAVVTVAYLHSAIRLTLWPAERFDSASPPES